MVDLPEVRTSAIQVEETKFKASVSEYTARRMGELLNLFRSTVIFERQFSMNGLVSYFVSKLAVDGIFVFPYDADIIDTIITGGPTAGAAGSNEFDVKLSAFPSGAWTSIYTTRPQMTSTAAAFASCGIGDTVTGCTAAVMTSAVIPVAKGDRMRMDPISAMGGAVDASLIIKFRPR